MKHLLLVLATLPLACISGHALTPAGTVIENQSFCLDESGAVIAASEIVSITVSQVGGVSLSLPASAKGQAGKTWQGNLSITNLGNGPDSFALSRLVGLSWQINLPDYIGILAMNESRQIPFSVAIPGGTAGQVDSIAITAISLFDGAGGNTVMNITSFKPGKSK